MRAHLSILLGALAHLAAAQTAAPLGPESGTGAAPVIPPTTTATGGGEGGDEGGGVGVCGIGYTYCGYILKNHNGWSDAVIQAAFCAGGGSCDSAGTPPSSGAYLSALYVCRPADVGTSPSPMGPAPPEPEPEPEADKPGRRWFRAKQQRARAGAGSPLSVEPPVPGPDDGGGEPMIPTAAPTASGCTSQDTGPHTLELLCACAGEEEPEQACLNQPPDYIGRCAKACTNA